MSGEPAGQRDTAHADRGMNRDLYPFVAVVGQERMKLALLLNAIDPAIGGVLLRGEKGSAKTTIVRALGALLPPVTVVAGCPYACDPANPFIDCPHCADGAREAIVRPARVAELPLGATEDRLLGSLHLERALRHGERQFEPGLLATAHRGLLYIDEVNLLPDHLVDLLLDAAASGWNRVEREGIAFAHPARFALIGTMNPEEGELRPQFLDRFGLAVDVAGLTDPRERAEAVRRRIAHEANPATFATRWAAEEHETAARLARARDFLPTVALDDNLLDLIAGICLRTGVDGLRADLTIYRAARAHAAWSGRTTVDADDVRLAAELALSHRRRRQPFDNSGLDQNELDQMMQEHQEQRQQAPSDTASEAEASAEGSPEDGGDGSPSSDEQEQFEPGQALPVTLPVPVGRKRASAGTIARRGSETHSLPRAGRPGAVRPAGESGVGHDPLAIAATLRAAATRQHERQGEAAGGNGAPALAVRTDDLRVRRRESPVGRCILFVVDASGSMAAQRRMALAKGAVQHLLRDAYGRRERVGLIAFRGGAAELLLPPTDSVELADTRLRALPTGGRTPLAHGLRLAADVAQQPGQRDVPILLILLSDGRANVALEGGDPLADTYAQARRLRDLGIQALVFGAEEGVLRLGLAERLATELGGEYRELAALDATSIAEAIAQTTERAR